MTETIRAAEAALGSDELVADAGAIQPVPSGGWSLTARQLACWKETSRYAGSSLHRITLVEGQFRDTLDGSIAVGYLAVDTSISGDYLDQAEDIQRAIDAEDIQRTIGFLSGWFAGVRAMRNELHASGD